MSTGQAACEDDRRTEAYRAHRHRLETLGFGKIAEIADELEQTLRRLEEDLVSLPRSGWARMDRLKELARRLG